MKKIKQKQNEKNNKISFTHHKILYLQFNKFKFGGFPKNLSPCSMGQLILF